MASHHARPFSRTLTGGKRYHAEKKLGHRPTKGVQDEHLNGEGKTAEKLGEQYGVSAITLTSPAGWPIMPGAFQPGPSHVRSEP